MLTLQCREAASRNGSLNRSDDSPRRIAILDAAARHLNTSGVSEEWFGDIAADLNITRPALYSHFEDRDELLYACYARTVEVLRDTFNSVREQPTDEGAVFDAFLRATINGDFPELAVISERGVLSAAKRSIIERRLGELVEIIAGVAADGARRGLLRPIIPAVAANAVLGLAMWAPLERRLLPGRPFPAVLSGAIEFFLHGIASDEAAGSPIEKVDAGSVLAPVDLFDREAVSRAKRERLLGVASGLFNRKGVGATRTEEIAEAVGLSKRAIFRLFGSKDRLVAACFERANEINLRIVREAKRAEASRLQVLHSAIRCVVLSLGHGSTPSLTSHVGLGRLSHVAQVEMQDGFAELGREYRTLLLDGIKDGSMRPIPVDDVVAAMSGILHWTASADLPNLQLPLRTVAVQIADLATFGLCAKRLRRR